TIRPSFPMRTSTSRTSAWRVRAYLTNSMLLSGVPSAPEWAVIRVFLFILLFLPIVFFQVRIDVDARRYGADQEHDHGQRRRAVIVQIPVKLVKQGDAQHLRRISSHQIRCGKGADV